MFKRIATLAAIGLCCTSVRAEPPKSPPTTAPNYVDNAVTANDQLANNAVLKKLEKVVPDVHLDDAKLSDAIELVRKQSELHIFVNWKSLEEAGIDKTMPITLHLKDKRLSTVLWLTLEIAGAERERLAFTVDDEYVTIATLRDLGKNTITRVYDLRVVIDAPGGPGRNARVEALLKLMMDAVDPESWRTRGGQVGSIRELQSQLIVTQTPVNQAKVALLVKNLVAFQGRGEAGK